MINRSKIRVKYTKEMCRRIYCLRAYDIPYKRIAAEFGISVHQVATALRKANNVIAWRREWRVVRNQEMRYDARISLLMSPVDPPNLIRQRGLL